MRRASIVRSLSAALTAASLVACAVGGSEPDDVAKGRSSSLGEDKESDHGDAGVPGTTYAASAKVTIGGRSCTVPGEAVGLDRGLAGYGWTLNINPEGCGFILQVSGVDNAPYPQTKTTPFLQEEGAILFTNEGTDGGVGGTYRGSLAGGAVSIVEGPSTEDGVRPIRGTATVVSESGEKRALTFDVAF